MGKCPEQGCAAFPFPATVRFFAQAGMKKIEKCRRGDIFQFIYV
jgi:hypothetical protein